MIAHKTASPLDGQLKPFMLLAQPYKHNKKGQRSDTAQAFRMIDRQSSGRRHHPFVFCQITHFLLQLLKSPHFDLADAFAANAVFLA